MKHAPPRTAPARGHVAANVIAIVALLVSIAALTLTILWKPSATGLPPGMTEAEAEQHQRELDEARHKAKQVKCASNLRAIGRGLMRWAYNDEKGWMPEDLTELDKRGFIRQKQLQSPLDPDETNVCDYFFAYDVRPTGDPNGWLLAWGNPAHDDGGAAVLHVDGHAEFLERAEFDKAMQRFLTEFEAEHGDPPTIIEPR